MNGEMFALSLLLPADRTFLHELKTFHKTVGFFNKYQSRAKRRGGFLVEKSININASMFYNFTEKASEHVDFHRIVSHAYRKLRL